MESSQRPLTATLRAGAGTSQSEHWFGTSKSGSATMKIIHGCFDVFSHSALLIVDGIVETGS